MIVTETDGSWGSATEVTDLPARATAANDGGYDYLQAVSCPSAGNCVATGGYQSAGSDADGTETIDPMVIQESNGNWGQGQALEPPSAPAAGSDDYEIAHLDSVACPSAGGCVAVGIYRDSSDNLQAMVATELNGVWEAPAELTLPANADPSLPDAQASSVSCPAAGSCTVGGAYWSLAQSSLEPMVIQESNGAWDQATEVGVPSGANAAPQASFYGLSCPAGGACVGVGDYQDASSQPQAMVDDESGPAPAISKTYTVDVPVEGSWQDPVSSGVLPWLSVSGSVTGTVTLTSSTTPTFGYVLPGAGAPHQTALLTITTSAGSTALSLLSGESFINERPGAGSNPNGPAAGTTSGIPIKLTGASSPKLAEQTLAISLGHTATHWNYNDTASSVNASYTDDLTFTWTLYPGALTGLAQVAGTSSNACSAVSSDISLEPGSYDFSPDVSTAPVCSVLKSGFTSLGSAFDEVPDAIIHTVQTDYAQVTHHAHHVESAPPTAPNAPLDQKADVQPLTGASVQHLAAQSLTGAAFGSAQEEMVTISAPVKSGPLATSQMLAGSKEITVLGGKLDGTKVELVISGPGYGATREILIRHHVAGVRVKLPRHRRKGRWFIGLFDLHGVHLQGGKLHGKALLESSTWVQG